MKGAFFRFIFGLSFVYFLSAPFVFADSITLSIHALASIQVSAAASWSDAHDAITGSLDTGSSAYVMASKYGDTNWHIYREGLIFDSSTVPVGAIIDSMTLRFQITNHGNPDNPDLDVVDFSPGTPGTVVGDDFNNLGTTVYGSGAISGLSNTGYNSISLSSFPTIGSSYTNVGLRVSNDVNNTSVTDVNFINFVQTTVDETPKLDITYHMVGGGTGTEFGTTSTTTIQQELHFMNTILMIILTWSVVLGFGILMYKYQPKIK